MQYEIDCAWAMGIATDDGNPASDVNEVVGATAPAASWLVDVALPVYAPATDALAAIEAGRWLEATKAQNAVWVRDAVRAFKSWC